jgi:hypothetical protein
LLNIKPWTPVPFFLSSLDALTIARMHKNFAIAFEFGRCKRHFAGLCCFTELGHWNVPNADEILSIHSLYKVVQKKVTLN